MGRRLTAWPLGRPAATARLEAAIRELQGAQPARHSFLHSLQRKGAGQAATQPKAAARKAVQLFKQPSCSTPVSPRAIPAVHRYAAATAQLLVLRGCMRCEITFTVWQSSLACHDQDQTHPCNISASTHTHDTERMGTYRFAEPLVESCSASSAPVADAPQKKSTGLVARLIQAFTGCKSTGRQQAKPQQAFVKPHSAAAKLSFGAGPPQSAEPISHVSSLLKPLQQSSPIKPARRQINLVVTAGPLISLQD